MINSLKNNYFLKLTIICFVSILIDYLFFINISEPPGWDQGYHLSNLFKMHNIIDVKDLDINNRLNKLIDVTNSYRGPLSYFLSSIVLKFFGNSYKTAYLSNHLFNVISVFSIYEIGRYIKDNKTGLWATIFFVLSPLIVKERSDYLIDTSLTAFSILNFLVLTKWKTDKSLISIYSLISGLIFGFVFLTKPTGIILFIIPLILLIFEKIFINKKYFILEIISFLSTFIFSIYFWFSKHFITIISSILNAWNWGINYQEGLDYNSFEGWFYYFYKIPNAFGILNLFIIIFLLVLFALRNKFQKINLFKIKKRHIWLFSYLLNFYLIASFMSTKDIRFMMPIYPLLCIYFSLIFNSIEFNKVEINWKRNIIIFSLTLSLLIPLKIKNDLNLYKNKNFLTVWPHEEIIKTIETKNPFIKSILAVIPDTKELNTFNLEAEAIRRGEKVIVRQVISNLNSYKDDLSYFDWFVIKTNDQGIMTSESKDMLQKYIIQSPSFIEEKYWKLPDNSKVSLYRRNSLNSFIDEKECDSNKNIFTIKQIPNGVNINLVGNGELFKNSSILLDFNNEELDLKTNFSLAQGSIGELLKNDSCYELSQNIPVKLELFKDKSNAYLNSRILNQNGDIKTLNSTETFLKINKNLFQDTNNVLYENKISILNRLGILAKEGRYEELINLVGILNQSDPQQNYLSNAEYIYEKRYSENKQLEDLYSILISQILQRKVNKANLIIEEIISQDSINGNTYALKAIINLYLLNPKEALKAINMSRTLDMSIESQSALKIIEGIANILKLNIKKGYQILS